MRLLRLCYAVEGHGGQGGVRPATHRAGGQVARPHILSTSTCVGYRSHGCRGRQLIVNLKNTHNRTRIKFTERRKINKCNSPDFKAEQHYLKQLQIAIGVGGTIKLVYFTVVS